ncbi:MAG: RNA 2',3'-cyclic phosphodiesterase [Cytophagaceae bacterium]|nr:RNA 2',3'-cyclic phosphodiesterase [Gemmatimonadaceae bacterium]
MRLFLALTFAPPLQEDVAEATRSLREALPALAWVSAPRLHLTLKFLGEVEPGAVDAIRTASEHAVRAARAHEVTIGGVGAFPNLRRPRVVWMDMHDTAQLIGIATALDQAVAVLGVPAETRPFRPHVTLARVKVPLTTSQGTVLAQRAAEIRVRLRVPVHEVALMQSSLGTGGPRYDVLATFPLQGH